MREDYWVGKSVYLPSRCSTIHDAVLVADVIAIKRAPQWTATVRLANGNAEEISWEELDAAYVRVQRLRQDNGDGH